MAWVAQATQTDALLVTLRKNEKDFSPTTMYRDFAISPELFHWESQNATRSRPRPGSVTCTTVSTGTTSCCSCVTRRTTIWGGRAVPLPRAGDHVEHQGERPIAITWRLRREMPGETFRAASVVAS